MPMAMRPMLPSYPPLRVPSSMLEIHSGSAQRKSVLASTSQIMSKTLYWVFGVTNDCFGGKGTFAYFLHAYYMVLCIRIKFLDI